MDDFQKQQDILHKLIKARDSIKRKYKLLKYNKATTEQALKETFQPIVEPLQKIASDTTTKRSSDQNSAQDQHLFFNQSHIPKFERNQIKFPLDTHNQSFSLPSTSKLNLPPFSTPKKDSFKFGETNSMNFSQTNLNETLIDRATTKEKVIDNSHDDYIQLLKKKDTVIDRIYGPRENIKGEFEIGNLPILFTPNNIIVGNTKYERTIGLTELILLKRPPYDVPKADKENYKKILEVSGAHLNKNGELKTHRNSAKFTDIISPMFQNKGYGILSKLPKQSTLPRFKIAHRNTSIDYRYWDDPNELVDRLRLLIAERDAGNNNHDNEILAIIEELREANYIY